MTESQKEFHIGEIDAEDDDFLKNAFVTTSHYSAALKNRYYLILGRKGSGKTALLKTIARKEKSRYSGVLQIKPMDINLEHLNLLQNATKEIPNFPISMFLVNTWRAFIWACVIKDIAAKYKDSLITDSNVKTIYNYAVNNNLIIPDAVTKFIKYARDIVKHIKIILQKKGQKDILDLIVDFPFEEVDFLEVREALSKYLKGKKYLILIDNVDEYQQVDPENEEMMALFYSSLLDATKAIHNEKELTIKLALCSDIFYGLHQRHRDKIRGHSHEILWSDKELKNFICKRLCLSPTAPKGVDFNKFKITWSKYFIEDKKIRVEHDYRLAYNCFEYMLYHSFRRPRDLMLCFEQINLCIDGELGEVKAKPEDVKLAVKRNCEQAIDYIWEEFYSRAPNAKHLVALFHNEEKVIKTEVFEKIIEERSSQTLTQSDYAELLDNLYEMYAIGISYDKELTAVYWAKPPKDVKFAYEGPAMPIATGCKSIVFHPVVAEALNMYRGTRVVPKRNRRNYV